MCGFKPPVLIVASSICSLLKIFMLLLTLPIRAPLHMVLAINVSTAASTLNCKFTYAV